LREISLSVRGVPPAPWGSNEWEWKRSIADKAREQPAPVANELGLDEAFFEVDIVFYWAKSSSTALTLTT